MMFRARHEAFSPLAAIRSAFSASVMQARCPRT
jgi:hypothetical protein